VARPGSAGDARHWPDGCAVFALDLPSAVEKAERSTRELPAADVTDPAQCRRPSTRLRRMVRWDRGQLRRVAGPADRG